MRQIKLLSLLSLAGFWIASTACNLTVQDKGEGDTDTDADSDSDSDADTDTDTDADSGSFDGDTAIIILGLRGEATVGAGYAGIESQYFDVVKAAPAYVGMELCTWTWDVTNVADTFSTACEDMSGNPCDFAFSLAGTNGSDRTGTHCATLLKNLPPTEIDGFSYGGIENFYYSGTGYGPMMLYYYSSYQAWGPPQYSMASWDSVAGDFIYDWPYKAYWISTDALDKLTNP